jgi:catechol 2,3-dioxygenase-like lactoylglutathione lyase family enzyme
VFFETAAFHGCRILFAVRLINTRATRKEREETMTTSEEYQLPPKEGFILTHFLTVADVQRSAEFYLRILGGTVVRSGEPTILQIANSWLIMNVGGGPTDDKPTVMLRPPVNPNEVSSFLNIRVADIWASYQQWRSRGAEFLTEPKDHGREIRCYMRDPDGYLIEVGQTTGSPT